MKLYELLQDFLGSYFRAHGWGYSGPGEENFIKNWIKGNDYQEVFLQYDTSKREALPVEKLPADSTGMQILKEIEILKKIDNMCWLVPATAEDRVFSEKIIKMIHTRLKQYERII